MRVASVPWAATTLGGVNDVFPSAHPGPGPDAAIDRPTDDPAVGPEVSARPPDVDGDVLDGLEADLVAVEEALSSLDRIAADGSGGAGAAAQIDAVVSAGRFPVDTDPPPIDLTDGPSTPGPDGWA
jgi:hypothetical protein